MPFLWSLASLEGAAFATFAYANVWPLGILATCNFMYSGHRCLYHHGRPVVLWRRGK
jgi:hypothetical protein